MTGREFRAARTEMGLSYDEVAEAFGVVPWTVRQWEKRPELKGLVALAMFALAAERDPDAEVRATFAAARSAIDRAVARGRDHEPRDLDAGRRRAAAAWLARHPDPYARRR